MGCLPSSTQVTVRLCFLAVQTLWENVLPSTQFRSRHCSAQLPKPPLGWEALVLWPGTNVLLTFYSGVLVCTWATEAQCAFALCFPSDSPIKAYIFLLLWFWHYFLLQIYSLYLAITSRFVRECLLFWIWSVEEWSFAKYQLRQVLTLSSLRSVGETLEALRGLALFHACLCEFQQALLCLNCHLLMPGWPSSVWALARHSLPPNGIVPRGI